MYEYYYIMKMRILLMTSFLFDVASSSGKSILTIQTASYKPQYTKENLLKDLQVLLTTSPSKLSCSGVCSSNTECKAFSFSAKTSLCQLYKKGSKTSSISTEPDGRVYYVRIETHDTTNLPADQPKDTSNFLRTGRILFAGVSVRSYVSQLTLGQNVPTINKYLFLGLQQFSDLQYSYSLHRLFIAQLRPDKIFSTPVRRRKKSVIRNGSYGRLSVEGGKGLLFASDGGQIYRMTTQGRLHRCVYHSSNPIHVIDLTIDPKQILVYVVVYSYKFHKYTVISLKYSGDDVNELFERTERHIRLAVFDTKSTTLVYAERHRLMSYDPSAKGQKHSILTTVDDFSGIAVHQGTLYFVDGKSLMEFDNKIGKKKTLVNIPRKEFYRLCIIN